MKEEAEALKEIAKTTSKAIDAAQTFGGFISKYIGGPIDQGVGIFEDRLKYMRWERQIRLMERAEQFLRSRGLQRPTRAVPMKIAVPIFHLGSLEDDDILQDIWAKLLVNAADGSFGKDIRRSYVAIIENITSFEAVILERIYSISDDVASDGGLYTAFLPDKITTIQPGSENDQQPNEDVKLALSNLIRLGCITPASSISGEQLLYRVYQTSFGKAFVEACTLREVIK